MFLLFTDQGNSIFSLEIRHLFHQTSKIQNTNLLLIDKKKMLLLSFKYKKKVIIIINNNEFNRFISSCFIF